MKKNSFILIALVILALAITQATTSPRPKHQQAIKLESVLVENGFQEKGPSLKCLSPCYLFVHELGTAYVYADGSFGYFIDVSDVKETAQAQASLLTNVLNSTYNTTIKLSVITELIEDPDFEPITRSGGGYAITIERYNGRLVIAIVPYGGANPPDLRTLET